MSTPLDDLAFLNKDDLIGRNDVSEAVRRVDYRALRSDPSQRLAYGGFSYRIELALGLIENENCGLAQERASQRKALP